MANEIVVLRIEPSGRRGLDLLAGVLFLYPLSPPIETSGGQQVVPTPAAGLPGEVGQLNLLTAEELADLDSGDLVFEETQVFLTAGQAQKLQSIAGKLRGVYRSSKFVETVRARYAFIGERIDA